VCRLFKNSLSDGGSSFNDSLLDWAREDGVDDGNRSDSRLEGVPDDGGLEAMERFKKNPADPLLDGHTEEVGLEVAESDGLEVSDIEERRLPPKLKSN